MISKKTKKILGLTLSLSVISSSIGIINLPTIAYAEETTGSAVSIKTEDTEKAEEADISNDGFKNAEGELRKKLDAYEFSKETSKVNIESELNDFNYKLENEETTGSAVTIKAKDIKNFENDGSALSFDGTLYDEENLDYTYNFSYSKEYNENSELESKPNQNILLTATLDSNSSDDWTIVKNEDYNDSYGNPYRRFYTKNGIVFIQSMKDTNNTVQVNYHTTDFNVENLVLPSEIEFKGTKLKVMKIGYYAFGECSTLKSVEIPESVEAMDKSAFASCTNLAEVKISSGLKNIGETAFYGCGKLENITIPDSVIKMDAAVFYGCEKLENITISNNLESIGQYAFQECNSLKSIKIPDSVTKMDEGVFYKCGNLENITIPSKVTSIKDYTFYQCVKLENIVFYPKLESIGQQAFQECSNLKSIIFPDNTTVGGWAFYGCSNNLTALKYKTSGTGDSQEITGIYTDNQSKTYVGSNIIIPDTICGIKVKEIAKGLFDNYADKIQSITCYNPDIKANIIGESTELKSKMKEIIDKNSISGDTTVTYDVNPHSIEVIGAPSGTTITYSTTETGAYNSTNPEYTQPGVYTVYYKVSGEGYEDLSGSASLKIIGKFVQGIEISAEGGVNAISTKNGSLKLKGVVSPSVATISALKWIIVSGQDSGSISKDGTFTANGIKNGTIIVRAEATDGSSILSNELTINVENQVSSQGGDSSSSSSSGSSSSSSDSEETKASNDTTEGEKKVNIEEQKSARNGWNLIGGKWYEVLDDGSYAKGWYKDVDGSWYYLDAKSGNMLTGWLHDIDGKWYYLNNSGVMVTKWEQADGKWYYFDNSGAMLTGWVKYTDGKWYYLYSDGSMAYSTTVDGYTVGSDGVWIQ